MTTIPAAFLRYPEPRIGTANVYTPSAAFSWLAAGRAI